MLNSGTSCLDLRHIFNPSFQGTVYVVSTAYTIDCIVLQSAELNIAATPARLNLRFPGN